MSAVNKRWQQCSKQCRRWQQSWWKHIRTNTCQWSLSEEADTVRRGRTANTVPRVARWECRAPR